MTEIIFMYLLEGEKFRLKGCTDLLMKTKRITSPTDQEPYRVLNAVNLGTGSPVYIQNHVDVIQIYGGMR